MLKTELLEMIANGESSGVEFKRDDIRPEQLAKEVVAMANLRGGTVLLGVEDDGTISGVNRGDIEEWVMNSITEKVHPMILPFYEEVRFEDKTVALISFTQGTSKPYVLRDRGREDVYIRIGTTSRIASREQQARLYESGGMLHSEVLPVAGSSLSSLSMERIQDYLAQVLQDPDVPGDEDTWTKRLIGLGYMTKGVSQTAVCTIAGILLFGISPRRYLPQAGVRLMVFDDENMEYQALLDEVLDSPIGWALACGRRTTYSCRN